MDEDLSPAKQTGRGIAAFMMENEVEVARTKDARYRDRRANERYEIDAPGGCLNYRGVQYPCLIVDVSLSGCCVRTEKHFEPGNLAHVEIVLPIQGMVLRMVGTTQWTTRKNLIGIRFLHASSRSKNQLASLLTCLVDRNAAEEVKTALAAAAHSAGSDLDVEFPDIDLKQTQLPPAAGKDAEPEPLAEKPLAPRRKGEVCSTEGDWPAILRIIKDGSYLTGVLAGISRRGCSFQINSSREIGMQTRVEVDFQMRGLPFRLLGITEQMQAEKNIGIRFLEMSFRKQGELAELIEELEEAEKAQASES
jgi:hypothetical protein